MRAVGAYTVLGSIPAKRRIGVCWERRGNGTEIGEDVVERRDVVVDSVSSRRHVGWSRPGYKAEAGSRSRMMRGIGS